MAKHYRSCPLCEAMCGLTIEVEGREVVSVRGDEEDSFSRGYLCPKGPALAALHADPERLRRPVRRDGSSWVEIPWEEAFELAARGLHEVQARHGKDAVALYLGNPVVHNLGASLYAPILMRGLGTKNRYTATSVDQLPHHLAAHLMFGHQFLIPVPDIDRTDHLLILGANPVVSNGSLMSAPGMKRRLKEIRDRGGKVVVVDPRRTETARVADEHHFVRPGTDAWLLGAIARIALTRGRGIGRLSSFVEGRDRLEDALATFDLPTAAERTGIEAATIERIAHELCDAPRAVCYGRMGTSTQAFGGLATWLVTVVNLLTGNLDRPGGAMFTQPAVDGIGLPFGLGLGRGGFRRWRSRVRGLPEQGGELPCATLADEMLSPGEGQVRGLVTLAGNPVLSTPNGKRLDDAIAQLEHYVAIDFYITETTRHATVILPPPSPLERPHYDVAFHHLAVRNTAKLSPALFEPGPDARHDHEIVLELVRRVRTLRGTLSTPERLRLAALERLGPVGLVDLALRLGPHGARAWPPRRGLGAKQLLDRPHGIDLGALEPALPERMKPWRDRIDIAPQAYIDDLDRLHQAPVAPALSLIGRRLQRSCNSWLHNVPKLMAGKPMCTLLMHPSDAAERGIQTGDQTRVVSRVGSIEVTAELTADLMPGVVSLPHGFGHHRSGTRWTTAEAHEGVSINDITDENAIDELTANASFSGVAVEVHLA